jgi:4-amino-4-deoxy-L-arabinose transferase-like glycosyltransferase
LQDNNETRRNVAESNYNERLGKQDLAAAAIFFIYCCLYAVLRLSISSTMEMDEAEQFLNGSFLSLGYANQPPFYSWLVYGMAKLSGLNIQTIIATKYIIMFFFYFSFYLIARSFWNMRASLLITGTLLIFPTYAYEFNRDLSHSVLVAAMSSITCYIFVRLLRRERTSDYLLLGASIGLGFLSKYNFAFFLLALMLAAASFREGRRTFFNKKIFLSFASFVLIVSPHVIWLYQNDYLPFRRALDKADAGTLDLSSARQILHIVAASYNGVLAFLVICLIFLGSSFSRRNLRNGYQSGLRLFHYLSFYGLIIPLLIIPVLKTGHFSERWLAPLLFSLPLAVFSGVNMLSNNRRFKLLGYLCVFIAVAILAARSFIGFFPDLSGKVERIHTPFRDVSQQLGQELAVRGIDDLRDITVISRSEFLTANVVACLPGAKFSLLSRDYRIIKSSSGNKVKVLVWDAVKKGEDVPEKYGPEFPSAVPLRPFKASYLRSSNLPPFVLGAALVQ